MYNIECANEPNYGFNDLSGRVERLICLKCYRSDFSLLDNAIQVLNLGVGDVDFYKKVCCNFCGEEFCVSIGIYGNVDRRLK